jgi:uncharacterized protein RhaS with RHS repeats
MAASLATPDIRAQGVVGEHALETARGDRVRALAAALRTLMTLWPAGNRARQGRQSWHSAKLNSASSVWD